MTQGFGLGYHDYRSTPEPTSPCGCGSRRSRRSTAGRSGEESLPRCDIHIALSQAGLVHEVAARAGSRSRAEEIALRIASNDQLAAQAITRAGTAGCGRRFDMAMRFRREPGAAMHRDAGSDTHAQRTWGERKLGEATDLQRRRCLPAPSRPEGCATAP